jgi:hypothetical protein
MATNHSRDGFLSELKRLKSEDDFDELLATAQDALLLFPEDEKFTYFLHYAQQHYVQQKLDSEVVEQLIEKKDYSSLAAVYQKLLTVFPESSELQRRLKKVHAKIEADRQNALSNFYDQAAEQIKDFIAKKNYESAIEACYEILDNQPENKTFLRLLARAESALDSAMNEQLALYYKEIMPVLRQEYTADRDKFITI